MAGVEPCCFHEIQCAIAGQEADPVGKSQREVRIMQAGDDSGAGASEIAESLQDAYLLRRVVVSGDPQVVNSGTDYYADGQFWVDGIWGIQDDSFFTVGFDLPVVIPTLSEWAMIAFALLTAAAGGMRAMRRRARA